MPDSYSLFSFFESLYYSSLVPKFYALFLYKLFKAILDPFDPYSYFLFKLFNFYYPCKYSYIQNTVMTMLLVMYLECTYSTAQV